MRRLYHLTLHGPSRRIRLALGEKDLEAELVEEPVWEWRDAFIALNPMGRVPVLEDGSDRVIQEAAVITEYLDEVATEPPLIGRDPAERAEARRLALWFDEKFQPEVLDPLIGEKVIKRLTGQGTPDSATIRAGTANLTIHMRYLAWLLERRDWLAGERLSIADLAAAACLSCADFIDQIRWDDSPAVKDWYARVKSRPSFRPLLADQVPGMRPPAHYTDLDF